MSNADQQPTAETPAVATSEHFASGATMTWHEAETERPVIAIWPAMGIGARAYRRFAEQLLTAGFSVARCDYRGQGDSTLALGREVQFGYRDVATGDMVPVLQRVRERAGRRPVIVLGHSLGGQLAAVLESEAPGQFDALALVASGTVYWRAYTGVGRLRSGLGPSLFALLARRSGVFEGKKFGFGRQSARFIADWARLSRTGSWSQPAHRRSDRAFELLALSTQGDHLAPASAVHALSDEFPRARVSQRQLLGDEGHTNWLGASETVVAAIDEWSRERVEN